VSVSIGSKDPIAHLCMQFTATSAALFACSLPRTLPPGMAHAQLRITRKYFLHSAAGCNRLKCASGESEPISEWALSDFLSLPHSVGTVPRLILEVRHVWRLHVMMTAFDTGFAAHADHHDHDSIIKSVCVCKQVC
jgi:hypothetical protein